MELRNFTVVALSSGNGCCLISSRLLSCDFFWRAIFECCGVHFVELFSSQVTLIKTIKIYCETLRVENPSGNRTSRRGRRLTFPRHYRIIVVTREDCWRVILRHEHTFNYTCLWFMEPLLIVFLTLNSFLTQPRDFSCAGKYRDDDNGIRSGCCCNRRVFVKVILSHSHRRREKGHLECEKNETWNPFYHFRISSCECYFLTHDSTPS